VFQSRSFPSSARALQIAVLAAWPFWGTSVSADEVAALARSGVSTIVVTAMKIPERVADVEVRNKVETALHSDPYFYDAHVTVIVKDGVVHLQGVVFDDWDLRTARRLSKRLVALNVS